MGSFSPFAFGISQHTQLLTRIGRFGRYLCNLLDHCITTQPVVLRPRFFSRYEWWYHLAMMPVLFPLGNYFFIGSRYFQNTQTFVAGTLVVFVLYWVSVITLTLAVRQIIARFPAVRQTRIRLLTMLVVVGILTTGLAIFDVWVYSLVPATGVRFQWETVQHIWVLGAVFDVLLCTTLGMFYTFSQWKDNQTETERLQRETLQHQFDALKGQVNPHFLFNSLSSLSALIGEDTQQAERFVDNLSKVYRHMLRSGDLVPLQTELDFTRAYADLLMTRYGKSLTIQLPQSTDGTAYCLPLLSLQTLIDSAINHNTMLPDCPLSIRVDIVDGPGVQVVNNLQRKSRTVAMQQGGLEQLLGKYNALGNGLVQIEEGNGTFRVTLPLILTEPEAN